MLPNVLKPPPPPLLFLCGLTVLSGSLQLRGDNAWICAGVIDPEPGDKMDLNNNGGPQRGTIMEPPTPADCKNQPLTSFLYTFFQGGLIWDAARSTPIILYQLGGVPAGRCRPQRDRSGERKHVQGKDGGDNPAHRIRLARAELGMTRTAGFYFLWGKGKKMSVNSHNGKPHTRIILMVSFFSAEDRGAASGAHLGLLSAGWSINTPLWTRFK